MSKKNESKIRKYPLSQTRVLSVNGKRYRSFSNREQNNDDEVEGVSIEHAFQKEHEVDSGGKIRVRIFVGNGNFGKIIGRKGSTIQRIQRESNTKIIIPPKGHDFTHYIHIEGMNEENIELCKKRIFEVIPSEPPKTHFLSIRIRKCRSIFENFQKRISQEFGNIIHPKMFMKPHRLHITFQVFSITSQEMLERTKRIMDEKIQPYIEKEFEKKKENCYIQYYGIGTFPENNPKNAKVVYFKPTHTESLSKLVDHINRVFIEEKIIKEEEIQEINFHSTILNTKYFRGRNRIDATDILKKYGDLKDSGFEEKKLEFKTLQLNILGWGENESDKYYKNDHKLFFF